MTASLSLGGGSTSLHAAVKAVMIDAAERAILPRYRLLAAHEIREKATDELVTIADTDSEAILSEGLARILPEAAIVGEEAAAADPSVLTLLRDRLCWIVDPLDGTGNFAAGEGPFGILIALADRGETLGGWIYDPRSRRFVAAYRGEGTRIDGTPVRSRTSGKVPPIAAISPLLAPMPDRADMLRRVERHFTTVPIPRCAAEQYPATILGISDVTLYERTLPWDHAAGVLCLTEAGGVVTRFDGTAYRADDDRSGLIAAATPAMWHAAFDQIGRSA
jgi:fructose-1,6-bisphosphatase/inositol monophosphatase family enzyme